VTAKAQFALGQVLLALWLGGAAANVYAASSPESVSVARADGQQPPLRGYLFRPAGPGPFPAVVMLHGCGGATKASGALGARHQMWGAYLAEHGYAALMLDSFSARGIQEICTIKMRDRPFKESERVADAYAALAFLQQHASVQPDRVAVLGWSHGGGVVLDTISRLPVPSARFQAAISFYPGCTAREKRAAQFHPYAPLLVLMGEADDWTPVAPCKALSQAVAARGEPMQIVTYPDTFHDFDNPALTAAKVRKEVPNGVHPGAGVTVAPNPEARADAQRRVLVFLAAQLGRNAENSP